jgi:putative DNA primase/helicase
MIPVALGTKDRPVAKWPDTPFERMQSAAWLDKLESQNIGVILGPKSDNLVSIDCDTEEAHAELLNQNPWLQQTLQSKGKRGGNFWLRMTGPYPEKIKKLYDVNGKPVGEFRSGGSFTIISGVHPEGMSYRLENEAPVLEVPFSEIVWPENWSVPWRKSLCDEIREREGEPLMQGKGGSMELNCPYWASLLRDVHMVEWDGETSVFRRYNDATGTWVTALEEELNELLNNLIKEAADLLKCPQLCFKRRPRLTQDILHNLKGKSSRKFSNCGADWVQVRNGVLHFSGDGVIDFVEFNPEYGSRGSLHVDYEPEAECTVFLTRLLQPVLNSEQIRVLQQFVGMILIGGSNLHQKMLLMWGAAGSGKSILLEVIQGILGREQCAELRTKHLESRFEMSAFAGKILLAGNDVPPGFLSENAAQRLKALTGGDLMDAEFKNQSGRAGFRGEFNVVVNCNGRPAFEFKSDADAWRRRLVVLRYRNSLPRPPSPGFVKWLLENEGSGILNWAICGYLQLREAGGFSGLLDVGNDADDLILSSDSLGYFVRRHVIRNEHSTVSTCELSRAYYDFCRLRQWVPLRRGVFERGLEERIIEQFAVSKSHDIKRDGTERNGFRGLEILDTPLTHEA